MHLHPCQSQPCPEAEWPHAGTLCGFPKPVIKKDKHYLHLNYRKTTAWHGRILLNLISYQQCVQSINEGEGETEGKWDK